VSRFFALTTAGSLIWNAILIGAGLALGRNWEVVSRTVGTYSNVVLITLLLGFVAAGAVVWRRRQQPG
jgi:membrane protein DedA with SNARE-associated domain